MLDNPEPVLEDDEDTFVATIRILTNGYEEKRLDKTFGCYTKTYNLCVRHLKKEIQNLYSDLWYQTALENYNRVKDRLEAVEKTSSIAREKLSTQKCTPAERSIARSIIKACSEERKALSQEKTLWANELAVCREAYGLSQTALESFIKVHRAKAMMGAEHSAIVQVIAREAFSSAQKKLFSNGRDIHFRKKGETRSISGKSSDTGIIFNKESWTVSFAGLELKLKELRSGDTWLAAALKHRVRFCRIKRECINGRYHYFLQLVLAGRSPWKVRPGKQVSGVDPGTSIMAFAAPGKAKYIELAPDVDRYEKAVQYWAGACERRLRMANPDNYNEDGTVKKPKKGERLRWKRTAGWKRAVMLLKSAYRTATEYRKQSHGYETNRIIEVSVTVVTEPMDYKALAKRSLEEAKRQSKASIITKKDGSKKEVYKFKRKKRFGSSIGRHAPAKFLSILKWKTFRYRGAYIEVDQWKYRASQYDFVTDTYTKPGLSERMKYIGGYPVQRDLYSAFLLSCYGTADKPDREKCDAMFPFFLDAQDNAFFEVSLTGDRTGNFGLIQFIRNAASASNTEAA